MEQRVREIEKDCNSSAQFLLDIGEEHIKVVKTGEHKLSKELEESKRIPIQVLKFFWTFFHIN